MSGSHQATMFRKRKLVRTGFFSIFLIVLLLFLNACSPFIQPGAKSSKDSAHQALDAGGEDSQEIQAENVVDDTRDAEVKTNPPDQATEVNPTKEVSISVENGDLYQASLKNAQTKKTVPGRILGRKTGWETQQFLDFNAKYILKYGVVDKDKHLEQKEISFTTTSAANEADAQIIPAKGSQNVGVGQPIQITFSEPVLNREELEKKISVKSSAGQETRIHWYSNQMLRIRPKEFWKPGSSVSVAVDMLGMDIGNSMIGNSNAKRNVTFGASRVAKVDNNTKEMTIEKNGEVIKKLPVTLGDENWPSSTGWHVISDKAPSTHFNPRSIGLKPGDPDWYEPFDAQWTFRLSTTGEFVHQALPAAISSVGVKNITHGCIGLDPAGAQWFYANMENGDPVQILNTGSENLGLDEGYSDWNIPWNKYAN